MAGASKTITVRVPVELHARIERARGMVKRERWAREAFELKLAGEEPQESVSAAASPTSARGNLAVPKSPYGGCEDHPAAGAVEAGGGWWCAHEGCPRRAQETVA